MKLLVSPQKKENWKINKEKFISQLKDIFEDIEITEIKDEKRNFCYEWKIESSNSFFYGLLDKQLNEVYFESNSISIIHKFSNFVRKFMPAESEILMYDEDFTTYTVLPYTGIEISEIMIFKK
ncbi:hypothetical protein CKY20_04995 [Capnocytophaga canis]|uniref:Uncharacterized protein n=1 Tax=Capnocytophaga canis TaxID=1848903 RepID=A0A3A1YHF1_9FLAO|nr:hypothetical protein [Capnocytophaga canis]RIY36886.1 hypothetical protein CKY20_04995 [Capnocytophaga canis]